MLACLLWLLMILLVFCVKHKFLRNVLGCIILTRILAVLQLIVYRFIVRPTRFGLWPDDPDEGHKGIKLFCILQVLLEVYLFRRFCFYMHVGGRWSCAGNPYSASVDGVYAIALKEYSNDLDLHFCNIVGLMMDCMKKYQNQCSRTRDSAHSSILS